MTATPHSPSGPDQPVIERASPTDRAFLAMDAWGQVPEQFGVILVLDQAGGFDLSRARQRIAERIPTVPRLRQRLIRAPFGCGGPVWVDDPQSDIGGPSAPLGALIRATNRRCWTPPSR